MAEWQKIAKAIEQNKKQKAKFQKAKQKMMKKWAGLLGVEWVQDYKIKYTVIVFTTFSQKYKKEKIKPHLIPVIMEKIQRDTKNSKDINCKAILRDFERVNQRDVVLLVTLEDLEEFHLYIDKDRLLKPNVSHGQVQMLLLLLPPLPLNPKKFYEEKAGLLSNQAYSSFMPINQPESFSISFSAPAFFYVPAFSAIFIPVVYAFSIFPGPAFIIT